jgi:hypothetical protein
MRKVSHGRKDTETMCFECHASIPSASSGSLLPASQKHHTRFARRKSATDHLYSTSEEALHKLTAKPALENPPCSTDSRASASQDLLTRSTVRTHQHGSIPPIPKETDEQPPPTESRQHLSPSPDLTIPASWNYRTRIRQETTSPQIGPPTLPRER